MSLYAVVELNKDVVDYLQTECEDEAIRCLDDAGPELTLDLRVPDNVLAASFRDVVQIVSSSTAPSTSSTSSTSTNGPSSSKKHNLNRTVAAAPKPAPTVPSFFIRSVPTDDYMTALPWHELEYCPAQGKRDEPSDNIFTIYNRAFDFDSEHVDEELGDTIVVTLKTWLQQMLTLRIVVAYNSGLAHHLSAVRRRRYSHESFAQALVHYQRALHMVLVQRGGMQYDAQLDILVMALYNNMGHCYAYLGNLPRSTWCFDHMLTSFLSSSQLHDLIPDEMVFFVDRINLGMSKKLRTANAA